jgi:hypothetical protein
MKKIVPFENTFLYATVEAGSAATDRDSAVEFIDGNVVSLVRVNAGGLCIYLDIATARSLASQILHVTNDGDLLWETEPMTGEEVDELTDALRAGVFRDSDGDPA